MSRHPILWLGLQSGNNVWYDWQNQDLPKSDHRVPNVNLDNLFSQELSWDIAHPAMTNSSVATPLNELALWECPIHCLRLEIKVVQNQLTHIYVFFLISRIFCPGHPFIKDVQIKVAQNQLKYIFVFMGFFGFFLKSDEFCPLDTL